MISAFFVASATPSMGAEAPIHIERCVVTSRTLLQDPLNGLRVDFVTGVSLRFTNVRPSPVSEVKFSLRYQGSSVSFTDRGTFATGVSIDRSYPAFSGMVSGGESAACSIVSATYADGTTWNAAQK